MRGHKFCSTQEQTVKIFARAASIVIVLASLAGSTGNTQPGSGKGLNWMTKDNNLKQIDGPPPDGRPAFRLYRSAAPSRKTFESWCKVYNIDRVIVLSGDAATYELKYQAAGVCPDIKVIHNSFHRFDLPFQKSFLDWFDGAIASARNDKAGVLMRCITGSHRTGQLAAYYQLKYMNMSLDAVVQDMNNDGSAMKFFDLWMMPQVRGLDDYVHNRPCSRQNAACVR